MRIQLLFILIFTIAACGDDDSPADSGAPPADAGDTEDSTVTDDAASDAPVEDDASAPDAETDAGVDAPAEDANLGTAMSFFVTSTAISGTGDLGGIDAADAHCRALAAAVDSPRTQWFAYLSTEGLDGADPVNAIDRIGEGPWYNQAGEVFATDLVALHPTIDPADDREGYIAVKPADALFMDENGAPIPGRSHDVFTGSRADGTVMPGETCQDWSSEDPDDTAQVGHTDTPTMVRFSPSWNSAHNSAGCDTDGVRQRGGVGLFYCFAVD